MPAEPPRVYLDANVLLAYVSDEDGRASVVQSLLDDGRHYRVALLTSTLSIAEVAYAAVSDGLPDLTAESETAIDQLWVPASPIGLVDVSQAVTRAARSVMRSASASEGAGVRSADAIHLATAQLYECDRFFTYEKESRRLRWNTLISANVSKPYSEAPQLDV